MCTQRKDGGDFSPTGLFPKWLQHQGFSQAESRNRESRLGLPGTCQDPKHFVGLSSLLFPGVLAGVWIGKWSQESWSWHYVGCWHSRWQLPFLCHNAALASGLVGQFEVDSNIRRKVHWFSVTPCTTSSTINIPQQSGTLIKTDEPALTQSNYLKSIIYSKVYPFVTHSVDLEVRKAMDSPLYYQTEWFYRLKKSTVLCLFTSHQPSAQIDSFLFSFFKQSPRFWAFQEYHIVRIMEYIAGSFWTKHSVAHIFSHGSETHLCMPFFIVPLVENNSQSPTDHSEWCPWSSLMGRFDGAPLPEPLIGSLPWKNGTSSMLVLKI